MEAEGTPSSRGEFPPLLADGFHPMTVIELRGLCVGRFPNSNTRGEIMAGLEAVIAELHEQQLTAELWVNGSFVTQKIDPEDADVSLAVPLSTGSHPTPEQDVCLRRIAGDDFKTRHHCDVYVFFRYPPSDPRHAAGERRAQEFEHWWSTARDGTSKGIAVLRLP